MECANIVIYSKAINININMLALFITKYRRESASPKELKDRYIDSVITSQ